MRSPRTVFLSSILLLATAILTSEPALGAGLVLETMREELDRSVEIFSKQPTPIYFLSYEITEDNRFLLQSSFGTISRSFEDERRLIDIDLRVGDPDLDNTHPIRGGFGSRFRRPSRAEIPVDDVEALRSTLWYQTDKRYKAAIEQLTKVKTNVQVKVQAEDQAGDFSSEPPQKSSEDPVSLRIDRPLWEEKLRKYTAPFSRSSHIYSADAALSANTETRWYVNSEGSEIQTSQSYYRLTISAFSKAEDGMELPRYESFFGSSGKWGGAASQRQAVETAALCKPWKNN